MNIDIEIKGIRLIADIPEDKPVVISGESGIGKSLFLRFLGGYCLIHNLRSKIFNVDDCDCLSVSEILSTVKKYDVVMFDDADIYITQELFDSLLGSCKYCIIVMHNMLALDFHDYKEMTVDFDGSILRLVGDFY